MSYTTNFSPYDERDDDVSYPLFRSCLAGGSDIWELVGPVADVVSRVVAAAIRYRFCAYTKNTFERNNVWFYYYALCGVTLFLYFTQRFRAYYVGCVMYSNRHRWRT